MFTSAARSPQPAARSPQPAARSPQPAARSPQPAIKYSLVILGLLLFFGSSSKAYSQAPSVSALIQYSAAAGFPNSFDFTGLGTVSNMPASCNYTIVIDFMKKSPGAPIATKLDTKTVNGNNGAAGTPQYQQNVPYSKNTTTPHGAGVGDEFYTYVSVTITLNMGGGPQVAPVPSLSVIPRP